MANSYLCIHSLEAVATNFNMSSRSFQRRLKEEGVTFLEIVEEVRKNLVIYYLDRKNAHHLPKSEYLKWLAAIFFEFSLFLIEMDNNYKNE